ncbi:hypothetical protein GEOBRER4_n1612 [Citrifermentans bremense]|uniref:Resolvase/invertase-type recombinase catalytic domain-containing protein n=1 Tax=Citrifermentans bremense TaxID=60035 RepID=A0A6S6LZQ8_9BACT|nr:recombinase family protein [Citrifermentans bremense]BCG46798.1 hypothetical protein GEOBRER4_n1612 [Citrifermentans bremense]
MATNYGYIDVPATTPEHYAQHYGILAFATNNGLGPVHFVNESASPPVPGTSPVLAGMVAELLPEDTMFVMTFPPLGKTTVEILNVLSDLSRRGVRVYVVNSGFRLDDNAEAHVVGTACSLIAQVETELVTRRPALKSTQEPPAEGQPTHSLRRTRKSRLDEKAGEIQSLLASGTTVAEVARLLSVNRQTLKDWCESRLLSKVQPLG